VASRKTCQHVRIKDDARAIVDARRLFHKPVGFDCADARILVLLRVLPAAYVVATLLDIVSRYVVRRDYQKRGPAL
jgi:hypothetical protein